LYAQSQNIGMSLIHWEQAYQWNSKNGKYWKSNNVSYA